MFDTVLIDFTVSTVSAMFTTPFNRLTAILVAMLFGYANLVIMLIVDYSFEVDLLAILSFCLGMFGLLVEFAAAVLRRTTTPTF